MKHLNALAVLSLFTCVTFLSAPALASVAADCETYNVLKGRELNFGQKKVKTAGPLLCAKKSEKVCECILTPQGFDSDIFNAMDVPAIDGVKRAGDLRCERIRAAGPLGGVETSCRFVAPAQSPQVIEQVYPQPTEAIR